MAEELIVLPGNVDSYQIYHSGGFQLIAQGLASSLLSVVLVADGIRESA